MGTEKAKRQDIQALRGLAIIAGLLYHTQSHHFSAGYIAIDIFLVVSGFLITGIIIRTMEAGEFSFIRFYAFRIRRLLPAAYVSLLAVIIAAPWFLGSIELEAFRMQSWGVIGFFSNFVFATERGYFSSASEYGPLLNFWSLSLEEQYYFIFPFLLFFAGMRFRRWLIPAILLGGLFILYKAYLFVTPTQSYFLLPTRAWQFALGGVGFLLINRFGQEGILPSAVSPIAYIGLVGLLLFAPVSNQPGITFHPIPAAGLICALTIAVALAREHPIWNTKLTQPLTWSGDLAYSIYLVHWPIIAFYRNYVARTELQVTEAAVLIIVCFFFGILLHYTVEKPFHQKKYGGMKQLYLFGFAGAAALAGLTLAITANPPKAREINNYGLGIECDNAQRSVSHPKCQKLPTDDSNRDPIFLWGDSFAVHLLDGWSENGQTPIVQGTKTACPPLLEMSPWLPTHNKTIAASCMDWNAKVYDYLTSSKSSETIILSSAWYLTLESENHKIYTRREGKVQKSPLSDKMIIASFRRIVSQFRAMGKKLVLVAPPPRSKFNPAICHERQELGLLSVHSPDCPIHELDRSHTDHNITKLLARIAKEADLPVFHFDIHLCKRGGDAQPICQTQIDGTPLYLDEGHFTSKGFAKLAKKIEFAAKVEAMAR